MLTSLFLEASFFFSTMSELPPFQHNSFLSPICPGTTQTSRHRLAHAVSAFWKFEWTPLHWKPQFPRNTCVHPHSSVERFVWEGLQAHVCLVTAVRMKEVLRIWRMKLFGWVDGVWLLVADVCFALVITPHYSWFPKLTCWRGMNLRKCHFPL